MGKGVNIGPEIGIEGEAEFRKQIQNINQSLTTLNTEMKATTAEFKNNATSTEALTEKNKTLKKQVGELSDKLKIQNQMLEYARKNYDEDSEEVQKWQQEVNKTQTALNKANAELEKNNDLIGENRRKILDGLGEGFKKLAEAAAVAVAAATTAVVAFAKSSVEAGMAFDSSMSQVAATMGVTVDEIQDLRDFAQEMGSKTAFSATEAADALNYMALAGYDAETSMEMLPNVLNLAAAGGIGLAEASDMVTDAASALGLNIEETATMVDQMAAASSKSNTSVAQLGEAILKIGATAANAAGGTQELTTILGALADNGIKGSEGGTHLRNMIMSLQQACEDGAVAFEDISIQVYDADGNMRNMVDIITDMQNEMGGLSQESKDMLLSGVFNKTDLAAVNSLLNTSQERFTELGAAINDSAGAAEKMAETQLDNLEGDITLFKSALEGAQIAISDQLTPTLRDFVQFGSGGLSQLTEAFKNGGLDGAMEAFGSILSDGLNMITQNLPSFVNAGMKLLGALGEGLLSNLPVIIDTAVQITTSLSESLMESLPTILQAGIDIVVGLIEGLNSALPDLIPVAIEAILELAETLTSPENLGNLIDAAFTLILALANGLIDSLPQLLEMAPIIIQNVVTALVQNTPKLLDAAFEIIMALCLGIFQNLPEILTSAYDIVKTLLLGLGQSVIEMVNMGHEMVEGFVNGWMEKFEWAWNKVKEWFGNVLQKVKDFLGIHSPSTVFANIGEQMAAGIGVGWDKEFDSVADDITDSMDSLLPSSTANIGVVSTMRGTGVQNAMATSVNALGSLMGGNSGNLTIQFVVNGREFSRAILPDFRMVQAQNPIIVNDF